MGEIFQVTEEVWSKFLIDLEENVLEVAHRNTIRANIVLFKPLIERLKEPTKVLRLSLRYDKRDLFMHLTRLFNSLKVALHEFLEPWMRLSTPFNESDSVAQAEPILEEER